MDNIMNGRLEKELIFEKQITENLALLPDIISEFYYDLSGSNKSYMTLEKYVDYVMDFVNFIKPADKNTFYKDIKPIDINKYMSSIRNKNVNGNIIRLGDSIRATRWSALNTFFEFLKDNGYIMENPVSFTKRPKVKDEHEVIYLTEDEIQIVLNNIKGKATYREMNRDLCIVGLAISTGLRVSALVQINISDINFENRTIKVIEKGQKYRTVSFGENTEKLIKSWLEDRELFYKPYYGSDALFTSQKKCRINTDAVRKIVNKYTNDVIPKHITPHKLRSTACTLLYSKTNDLYLCAEVLGHKNVSTTQRYTKVFDEKKEKATNILDNLV